MEGTNLPRSHGFPLTFDRDAVEKGDPIDVGICMGTSAECSSRRSRPPSPRKMHRITWRLFHALGWQRNERWYEWIPDPKAPPPWFERPVCWQEVGASGALGERGPSDVSRCKGR